MTIARRIMKFISGVVMIPFAVILNISPEQGLVMIISVLTLMLILRALSNLMFYFSMGRHMVGGKRLLTRAMIMLDLGLFAYSITDVPSIYIVLYLLFIHAFSGAVDVLGALDAKKLDSGSWKIKMATGIFNIAVGILCLAFLHSISMIVYIYSAGLIINAISRIVSAFKRTAVVYVS